VIPSGSALRAFLEAWDEPIPLGVNVTGEWDPEMCWHQHAAGTGALLQQLTSARPGTDPVAAEQPAPPNSRRPTRACWTCGREVALMRFRARTCVRTTGLALCQWGLPFSFNYGLK
jgi:hypothetical protein